jgi:D-amino-acid oxidase
VDPNRPDVVIVGAGVVGLSTANRLAESRINLRVRVYAERRGDGICSYAAGAMFDPSLARHPHRETWAEATLQEFGRLLAYEKLPWIRFLDGIEAARTPIKVPPGFRECSPAELPNGFVAGWHFQSPLIEMPPYLEWLEQRLKAAGGELVDRRLESLADGFADADVVVNCSGIGALDLVEGETSLRPVRGQLVVVQNPNPAAPTFFVEHTTDLDLEESTYVLPHGDVLLLGGNTKEGEFEAVSDPEVTRRILDRCIDAFPALADAEVRDKRVGVRPYRTEVRLEVERVGSRHIVHNYGHGGSGVSLAWGCAGEVLDIVSALLELPEVRDLDSVSV